MGSEVRPSTAHHGAPETFDTDQGSQFTSRHFLEAVWAVGTRIFMDEQARWVGYVFIERLWRSLEYECIYGAHPGSAQSCGWAPATSATTKAINHT